MPFDAGGNFTRLYSWQTDRNNNIKILASRMDAEFDNFATGMNQVFFRNGLVAMTGDLDLGLNKIVRLADGANASPAIKFGSDVTSGIFLDGIGRPAITATGVKRLVAHATGVDAIGVFTASGAVTFSSTLAVTGAITSGGNTVATLNSPAFTGTPTAPTAAPGTNTTQLATTAFVVSSYAPLASPTFTGTPAAPTAAPGTNSTQVATTAFVVTSFANLGGGTFTGAISVPDVAYGVGWDASTAVPTRNAVYDQMELKSNLNSPTFTGVPAAPTAGPGTNTTQIATTAYVVTSFAPLASPALTGNPTAPTQAVANNSTRIATTAYVQGEFAASSKRTLPVMAGAMWPRTTNPCASVAKTELATNKINYMSLDYDPTTSEYAQFSVPMPKSWDEGTITYDVLWTAAAGTAAQGCVFGLSAVAISDDDPLDAAFGAEVLVTDALLALSDLHVSPTSAAVTVAGTPQNADFVMFQIRRLPADASDTLTGDAKLLGVRVYYNTNAKDDT